MVSFLALSAALLALFAAFSLALIHWAFRAPRLPESGSPGAFGLLYRTVYIPTKNGKKLFGWFIPPPGPGPAPAIAVLHGWGGNAELMLPFAPFLHDAGYALLFLDARSHGQSEKDGFSSMVKFAEDLEHGIKWLEKQPGILAGRIGVLGHSVGAAAALLAASRNASVGAVLSIAAFAHPALVMRRMMAGYHIPYRPLGWWVLWYVQKRIGASYDAIAPCNTIQRVSCPVLLIHGEQDAWVPLSDAELIYANRRSDAVQLRVLPDTGHDSRHQIDRYGHEVAAFFVRALSGLDHPVGKQ